MKKRIHALIEFLATKKLDAMLISSPLNIVYYTNFSGFSSVERDGYVLITKNTSYILTSALYAEAIKKEVPEMTLLEYSAKKNVTDHLHTIVKKHRVQKIGFESSDLRVSEWKSLNKVFSQFVPIHIDPLRMIKDVPEIDAIHKASKIADTALSEILTLIKPGMTEKRLVYFLENELRESVTDIAFPTIVAYGKNAAIPHHKSDDTTLKKNDLILIDFGAVHNEYRSDMTRTLFIGTVPEMQKKAYAAVLGAQQHAVRFIEEALAKKKPIKAAEVDKAAREYLVALEYPSIPHSLGHGIGLAVHETPSLSPRSPEILTEGMVFSIEPGVYFPEDFGIRIEDLYSIQKGKLTQLTTFPSHLIQI